MDAMIRGRHGHESLPLGLGAHETGEGLCQGIYWRLKTSPPLTR